jgi:hypothetical protein
VPKTLALILALLVACTAACAGSGSAPQGTATPSAPTAAPSSARPRPSRSTTPPTDPRAPRAFNRPEVVPASANLFGAGRDFPPAPGGGGAGDVPPVWPLPANAGVVTVSATGTVNCCEGMRPDNGPAGNRTDPTDVKSFEGIAGLVHRNNAMFLAGLFLGDAEAQDPAPARLDFTKQPNFTVLSPLIGQTFYAGDGKGRTFRIPRGATRLFLGFVDAFDFVGEPGFYGNNRGQFEVVGAAK